MDYAYCPARVENRKFGELCKVKPRRFQYEYAASHIGAVDLTSVPPVPKRWVSSRKAEVVTAVSCGFISLEDALERYAISMEEFLAWQRGFDFHGLAGLRLNGIRRRRRIPFKRSPARPWKSKPRCQARNSSIEIA